LSISGLKIVSEITIVAVFEIIYPERAMPFEKQIKET